MASGILWFAVGVVVLALGADSLVRGLAGLGARLGAGAFALGVLLTAFGGSAPDLAINVDAVVRGHGALALGNIVGSCLVNIGLGIGLCALVRPLEVHLPLLRPFVIALIAAGIVLLAAAHNGTFGYLDGGLLVVAFVALGVIAVRHRATRAAPATVAVFEAEGATRTHVGLNLLRLAIGVPLAWYGAHMAVGEAVFLARQNAGFSIALGDDVAHQRRIIEIGLSALTHRRLLLEDAVDHRLLALEATDTRAAATLLHPVLARIVRIHLVQPPDRALVRITRIGATHARRISRHALDLLRHRGFVFAQSDRVVVRLGHFLPIEPRHL